ncbi:tRNA/rRNA cytosine-C5-methylase [Algoriphagus namhaensis]|uniref:tRNA/rRNA cytosine-C5-methylase n=1 Tax=Algoriphagus namhaensis TaxID=915353 RepID=A0ABV8AQR1_9BACT
MSKIELPSPFQDQMRELLGEVEYQAFADAVDENSKTSIRLNPKKSPLIPVGSQPVPWCENAYLLSKRPSFTRDPALHAGAYYVQESSSMFLDWILNSISIPKGVYLDLSAAPGGKSTLLSAYLGDEGLLVANEVIQSRAQILKENIIKWGLGNCVVTNNDPEHFSDLEGFFDLVLIDAPCSGEGMFRKDPKARNEWSPDNVQLCAARQTRILDQAGALVKAGGYLIYSTCTFNQKENEEMIQFLVNEFSFEPVRLPLNSQWGIRESSISADDEDFYGYRFFPHLVPGEGFFVSVLKRPTDTYSFDPKKSKDFKHPFLKEIWKKDSEALDEELGMDGTGKYYSLNDSLFRVNQSFVPHFEAILSALNVRYFGVELGKKQGDHWLPTTAWAMSTLPKEGFAKKDLELEEALTFLRKQELEQNNLPEGWVLITYQGKGLGWVKNLGNRVNNYYPKEWRIRL